jgi:glutamine synthetase
LRLTKYTPAPLPASLAEAMDRFEARPEAAAWFGPEFHAVYVRFKRAELKALAGLDEAAICDRYAAIY